MYKPLKPGETVDTIVNHLSSLLLEKIPEYRNRQHNNIPLHTTKGVGGTLETLSWEVLPHAAYSLDLAPSDNPLFEWMSHALIEQRFSSYEDFQTNGSKNGSWAKGEDFYWRGIHKLSERWGKCITSDEENFE